MSSSDFIQLIPEAHRAAAATALSTQFAEGAVRGITPLTGGRSTALVYRIDLADRSAVLRIVTQRNQLADPVRQFAAMRLAAEAGVAPAVHFSDSDAGVVITDFVPSQPWNELLRTEPASIEDIGRTLRHLHNGPAMPPFLDAFQCIEQGVKGLQGAGVTLSPMLASLLTHIESVHEVLKPHLVLGPSHNDLNPGNLLHDGHRFWIIDWDAAWQNDPMFDVATVLHWFGFEGPAEATFLRGYFGGEPTAVESAKLLLMRQVVSGYYAVIFLLLALQRGILPPPLEPDPDSLPDFAEARRMMGERTLPLVTGADHSRFSLVMANEATRASRGPAFAAALGLLRGEVTSDSPLC